MKGGWEMRNTAVCLIIFILIIPLLNASESPKVATQTSNYDGIEYRAFLTLEQVAKTKNFDIESSSFPQSLDKITYIAKKQVMRVDSAAEWEINSINLQRTHYSNEKYWYYRIQFNSANKYFMILISLDGTPCEIIKIKEEPL
jgi:hypothetical protein